MARNILSLALVCLLCASAYAESSSLPSAPTPIAVKQPVFTTVDWSLAASVIAARTLDWTSTEECLRRPYAQCHEVELPNSLVHNKVGFAGFEAAMSAVSIFGQYEMTRRGHLKLARIAQAIDVGVMAHTVARNYQLDTTPPLTGMRLIH